MIISPPFLPVGAGNIVDIDAVMRGDGPGNGGFPVSFELAWHGGIHLDAPMAGSAAIPVRAIADGIVKYAGECATNIAEGSPLFYYAGETSNGVVVIEHTTEIGEEVEVIFYSIYMHLIELKEGVAAGKKIYRKDELGIAGRIYGQPNKIHMEIVCDDANLKKLVGRSSGKLDISNDGRTDALWGDMYFAVPAGTPVYAVNPGIAKAAADKASHLAEAARAKASAAVAKANAAPTDTKLAQLASTAQATANIAQQKADAATQKASATPSGTTDIPVFVGMRYERGTCTLTTYSEDGTELGTVADAGYEYQLYENATELYPQCPSAGFELLRFGRVIGPDELQPADAGHWRKIATASGEGWVDLRPDAIKKFSDADFPHWRGWLLVDDDTNGDSRCDSAIIKKIIVPNCTVATSPVEYHAGLAAATVQKNLQRTICKIPSTWSSQDLDKKWGWVKSSSEAEQSSTLQSPMDDENFQKLKAHLEAQMFWDKAGLPNVEYWHFNPREFIGAFRHCGWLSLSEMKQMFPMTAMRKSKGVWVSEAVTPTDLVEYQVVLNKATRKFLINSPNRMACFYGNSMQETQWFGKLHENNASAWYFPWDGRGFLQLTHPANYFKYWAFLGREISSTLKTHLEAAQKAKNSHNLQDAQNTTLTSEMKQWREDVRKEPFDASDSACAYWAWSNAAQPADNASSNILSNKSIGAGKLFYYTNESFGQVAATVNFGHVVSDPSSINKVNGIEARYQAYTTAIMVFGDMPAFPDDAGSIQSTPKGYKPRR